LNAGWIERERVTKQLAEKYDVKIGSYIYIVYDEKQYKNTKECKKPNYDENQIMEKPQLGKNHKHTKTDYPTKTDSFTKTKSVRKSTHTKLPTNEKTYNLMEQLQVDETFIEEIEKYRKEIKAPFKTALGLNNLLTEYLNIMKSLNISPYKIFEIQASKEWKSVKVEWIQRELQEDVSNKWSGIVSDKVAKGMNAVEEFMNS